MECPHRIPPPVPSVFQRRQNLQPALGRPPGPASRQGTTTFLACGYPGLVSAASTPPSRQPDNGTPPLTRLAAVETANAATTLFLVQGKHTVLPCFFISTILLYTYVLVITKKEKKSEKSFTVYQLKYNLRR